MEIIERIDRGLLCNELNDNTFARRTNKGNKEIHIVDYLNSPNTTKEIGRLREITFREAGGGTGMELDIDQYDTAEIPFKQLIVWDPVEQEIVGGYRYLEGYEILKSGYENPLTPTSNLFEFSDKFKKEFMPSTFELGRSFVQPKYQPNIDIRKGMYALDNLWDGIGYLTVLQPDMKYFFGKFTMYPSFNEEARDAIHFFLNLYFGDKDSLLTPLHKIGYKTDIDKLKTLFLGDDYDKEFKLLIQKVRSLGENIPPLVNAYMNLSNNMKYFGSSINHSFGKVEESGILIHIPSIYEQKKERHIRHVNRDRIEI